MLWPYFVRVINNDSYARDIMFTRPFAMASTSAPKRPRSDGSEDDKENATPDGSVTAILTFSDVALMAPQPEDFVEPAKAICRKLMGGKERVTRCFFSEAGLDRAVALAPQLQSVWVALYQGQGVLLSGSIGFTFAGKGPLPQRSDLVVGDVARAYNMMIYVLEWPELVYADLEMHADDWLLLGGGDIIAETLKTQHERHYPWFEAGSYQAPYLNEMDRAVVDGEWERCVGHVTDACENRPQ
jgi:hypothetical protein